MLLLFASMSMAKKAIASLLVIASLASVAAATVFMLRGNWSASLSGVMGLIVCLEVLYFLRGPNVAPKKRSAFLRKHDKLMVTLFLLTVLACLGLALWWGVRNLNLL